MPEQVGASAGIEPVERAASRRAVKKEPHGCDGVSPCERGTSRIEHIRVERAARRVSRLGSGEQRRDRWLGEYEPADELGMVTRQLQRGVRAVRRTDDLCRREFQRQQHGREILGVQLGGVRLIVLGLGIRPMIATAVHQHAVSLREEILLA